MINDTRDHFLRRQYDRFAVVDFLHDRGEFPAVYTHRGLEAGGRGESFLEAFTRNVDIGDGIGMGAYARYDPPYDRLFLDICSKVSSQYFPTVVVPIACSDEKAMALVATCDSISKAYLCRFLELSKRARMPAHICLFDLIRPMPLPVEWAYLIKAIHPLGSSLLVAHEAGLVDSFERGEGLEQLDGVVERW